MVLFGELGRGGLNAPTFKIVWTSGREVGVLSVGGAGVPVQGSSNPDKVDAE